MAFVLTDAEIDAFVADGIIAIRGAVPSAIVSECAAQIWTALEEEGVHRANPTTWTEPVVRIGCPESPAFAAAGTQPALWEAYDALIGPDRWTKRHGVGGTIPARFPHPDDPGDAGWHIDGSFAVGDKGWVNYRSKERGLLCLFLFSDVAETDAPTEAKIGSHVDIAGELEPLGDTGRPFDGAAISAATLARPSVFATGKAGDVFVCHPFLVHRATWPHTGATPRLMAQPGVHIAEPFALDEHNPAPVERAILVGLDRRVGT